MKKIKLLMVDDNVQLIEAVSEYFKGNDKIEVAYKAYDGKEGMDVIEREKDNFDLVILDLIMPNKDGLYVLQQMKEKNINKSVIVATSYNATEVIREVSEYGVNYYILKPFDLEDLEKRVLDVFNREYETKSIDIKHNNLQVSITKILHELGIPSHIKGYQYIREGIGILYERPETIGGITKELYPELANKFDTTVSRVD